LLIECKLKIALLVTFLSFYENKEEKSTAIYVVFLIVHSKSSLDSIFFRLKSYLTGCK